MKFWEAMKALEEGKKVYVPSWCGLIKWHMKSAGGTPIIVPDHNQPGLDFAVHLYNYMGSEWEIYEEPVKTYTFMEAVQLMKEGNKIKRKKWNGWMCCEIVRSLSFELQDFEATDWVVLE